MAKLKFTVEFEIDESWVADGFNPDDDQAKEMLARRLAYAQGHEMRARVIKPIDQSRAAKLMGYGSVAAMNKVRKKDGDQLLHRRGK